MSNRPGEERPDNTQPRSHAGGADIVERLRLSACGDCQRAADEIERLREQFDEADKVAARYIQEAERRRNENAKLKIAALNDDRQQLKLESMANQSRL